jgi:hypothetical protein
VAQRFNVLECCGNKRLQVDPTVGPTAQDDYRDGTIVKVLLIRNFLIDGYDYVEPGAFGSHQQGTILQSSQSSKPSRLTVVLCE